MESKLQKLRNLSKERKQRELKDKYDNRDLSLNISPLLCQKNDKQSITSDLNKRRWASKEKKIQEMKLKDSMLDTPVEKPNKISPNRVSFEEDYFLEVKVDRPISKIIETEVVNHHISESSSDKKQRRIEVRWVKSKKDQVVLDKKVMVKKKENTIKPVLDRTLKDKNKDHNSSKKAHPARSILPKPKQSCNNKSERLTEERTRTSSLQRRKNSRSKSIIFSKTQQFTSVNIIFSKETQDRSNVKEADRLLSALDLLIHRKETD